MKFIKSLAFMFCLIAVAMGAKSTDQYKDTLPAIRGSKPTDQYKYTNLMIRGAKLTDQYKDANPEKPIKFI